MNSIIYWDAAMQNAPHMRYTLRFAYFMRLHMLWCIYMKFFLHYPHQIFALDKHFFVFVKLFYFTHFAHQYHQLLHMNNT